MASIDQRHFNLVNIRTNQKLLGAHVHLRLAFFSEMHIIMCVKLYLKDYFEEKL